MLTLRIHSPHPPQQHHPRQRTICFIIILILIIFINFNGNGTLYPLPPTLLPAILNNTI